MGEGPIEEVWRRRFSVSRSNPVSGGSHFSCSMTAVLLARVQAFGGPKAVAELLVTVAMESSP
jgi:hypothetical protein